MLSSSDSIQVLLGREQRFLLKKKKLSNALENVSAQRVWVACFLWMQAGERNADPSAERSHTCEMHDYRPHDLGTNGLHPESYITQKGWEHIFSFPKYMYTMLSVHMPQPFPTEGHGASLKQFSFPLFTCLVRTCKLKKKWDSAYFMAREGKLILFHIIRRDFIYILTNVLTDYCHPETATLVFSPGHTSEFQREQRRQREQQRAHLTRPASSQTADTHWVCHKQFSKLPV